MEGSRVLIFEEVVGREIQWKKHSLYQVDGIHIEHGHQYEADQSDGSYSAFSDGSAFNEPILNIFRGERFYYSIVIT